MASESLAKSIFSDFILMTLWPYGSEKCLMKSKPFASNHKSICNRECFLSLPLPASPTRRMCMEFNNKNNAGKLNPSGDNSEYQEEAENDIDDDDDMSMEQNFTDVGT